MKSILLFFLNGRHENALLNFHHSKYNHNQWAQQERWNRVLFWRNLIRRIDKDFLKGFD